MFRTCIEHGAYRTNALSELKLTMTEKRTQKLFSPRSALNEQTTTKKKAEKKKRQKRPENL
jgi:hypothetical protein